MENLPQFSIIDIAAMALVAVGLVRGMTRGLSGELARLAGALAAVAAGWFSYRPFGEFLARVTRLSGAGSYALAFILTLVGAFVVMRILRFVLRHIMEFSFKGKIERVGGALAGLIRMTLVCAALLLAGGLSPNSYLHRVFAEDSRLGRFVFEKLGPVYERWSEKHREPKGQSEEGLDEESMMGDSKGAAGKEQGKHRAPGGGTSE